MKIITSECQRKFLSSIFRNNSGCRRLDGREPYDGRNLEIVFGNERGCCIVMQGNTRVIAQVSCEILQPKPSRPAEGTLLVNLEFSPMAAPYFETGRISDEGIESTRLLERCIRDSRCIELESLCIVAGEKVWNITVDVQVLNHDGNVIECSSIAAISALSHFRRPDVTVIGTDVTVHSPDDRNPVPLNLHHMPVSITMAIYEMGQFILLDPVEIEEKEAEGRIVIGVNSHQEICSLHLSGGLVLTKEKLLQCTDLAIKRAQVITQSIRNAIDEDLHKRTTNQPFGFISMLQCGSILGAKKPALRIIVDKVEINMKHQDTIETVKIEEVNENSRIGFTSTNIEPSLTVHRTRAFLEACAETATFEGGSSKWDVEITDESDSNGDESANDIPVKQDEEMSDETESEDEGAVLQCDQVDGKPETSQSARGWYTKNAFM